MLHTINKMLDQMRKEEITSIEVVDRADAQFRKEYCRDMDSDTTRSILLGTFKAQLSNALDEIKRLRTELAAYEEIKFDSEADVFCDEHKAA